MDLKVYKKGQGKLARGVAFGSIALLLLYGSRSFYWALDRWTAPEAGGHGWPFRTWLEVPLLGLPVNPALVICLLLFSGLALATYVFLNRPKAADLMIETETEFRKITWPSWQEAFNSALVVIGTSLALAFLLFVFDMGLHQVFEKIFTKR